MTANVTLDTSPVADPLWSLAIERPLAWGGWEFVLTGPSEKRLEWWPGDTHLSWMQRPFLAAPVRVDSAKAARSAAKALIERLNAQTADVARLLGETS